MPPNPKPDTALTRRSSSHGRARSRNTNGLVSASHTSLGSRTCSVGGWMPWYMALDALMSEAIPAAHLMWPMFDFTDPMTTLPTAAPAAAKTSVVVPSSMRSPVGVPVPWASTRPTSVGE